MTPTHSSRDQEDGSAMLEFALVVVPFFLLLYGIVTFGVIFAAQQTITHAAAEGARSAVGAVPGSELAVSHSVTTGAMGWLDGRIDPTNDVASAVGPCPNDPALRCVTVTVDYPYSRRPIVPDVPLLGFLVPDNVRTTAVTSIEP